MAASWMTTQQLLLPVLLTRPLHLLLLSLLLPCCHPALLLQRLRQQWLLPASPC
jgi:hypothetical protein